jgi:hypothetical protein
MCDGSVLYLKETMDENTYHALGGKADRVAIDASKLGN